MRAVKKELDKFNLRKKLIVQKTNMSERKRKKILQILKKPERNYLLMGVQGGIFSEGVDYEGEMAIGIFIIGPGLPTYCFEQELIKNYFSMKFQKGFEYAYRNIGMTRVIQASGRIFRSENDKGFIVLIGQRFETSYYRNVLPKDWKIIKTKKVIGEIKKFWETNTVLDFLISKNTRS